MAKKQKYETVFLLQSFGSKKSRNEEETKICCQITNG